MKLIKFYLYSGRLLAPPPGNFAFCCMKDMTFNSVSFSDWEAKKMQGTVLENCVFGEGTHWSLDQFNLIADLNDLLTCTFDAPCTEIEEFDKNDKESINTINDRLIALVVEPGKKIRELKQENKTLIQENEALRAQLLGALPPIAPQASSSSTPGFFDSSERRAHHQTQEDLSDTQMTCKTYKRGT